MALQPVRPGGLRNAVPVKEPGSGSSPNWCFMNSMLQGLLRVPCFVQWLFAYGEQSICQQLKHLVLNTVRAGQEGDIMGLLENIMDSGCAAYMNIHMREQAPSPLHLGPSDPEQAYTGLLALLVDKAQPGPAAHELKRLARFQRAPEHSCTRCKATRGNFEELYLIELQWSSMEPFDSVGQGLAMLAARSQIQKDVRCTACGSATRSRWALEDLPEGLVGVSINRLEGSRDVTVCPRITLRASGGPLRSYELTAVIAHRGSANSGHFVAYVLHGEAPQPRRWWLCNDPCVTQVPNFDPRTCKEVQRHAGLLIYKACDPPLLAPAPVRVSRPSAAAAAPPSRHECQGTSSGLPAKLNRQASQDPGSPMIPAQWPARSKPTGGPPVQQAAPPRRLSGEQQRQADLLQKRADAAARDSQLRAAAAEQAALQAQADKAAAAQKKRAAAADKARQQDPQRQRDTTRMSAQPAASAAAATPAGPSAAALGPEQAHPQTAKQRKAAKKEQRDARKDKARLAAAAAAEAKHEAAQRLLEQQTLAACFNHWRSAVVYTRGLEDKLAGVVLQRQTAALAAAFAALRANTEKQRLKKRALQHFANNKALATAFKTWRDHVVEQQVDSAQLQTACQRWRQSALAKAFATWVDWHLYQRDRASRMARAAQQWRDHLLAAAFRHWHSRSLHRKDHFMKLEACLQRMLHLRLSLAFNAMRESAQEARHRRRAQASARTQRSLAGAFFAFRVNVAHQQRKRHAVVLWTGRRLAPSFTAWQDYATRKRLYGDKLQRAAALRSKQALAAAFYGWIKGSAHQQQKRAALSKAAAFWRSSALASSLHGWTEAVAEVQRERAARVIHRAWAAHVLRRRFAALLGELRLEHAQRTAAALLGQRLWRGRRARRLFVATRAAVRLAQRRWRGSAARRHTQQLLAQQQARRAAATLVVQRHLRGALAHRRVAQVRQAAAARQQAEAAGAIQRALVVSQQLKALAMQPARAAAALVLQQHARRWLARQQLGRLAAALAVSGRRQAETQLGQSASDELQAKGRDSHPSAEPIEAAAVSAQPTAEAAANTKDGPPAGAHAAGRDSHPSAEHIEAAAVPAQPTAEAAANTEDGPPAGAHAAGRASHSSAGHIEAAAVPAHCGVEATANIKDGPPAGAQAAGRASHSSAGHIEAAAVPAHCGAEAAANIKDGPPAGAQAAGRASHSSAGHIEAAAVSARRGAEAAVGIREAPPSRALAVGICSHPSAEQAGAIAGSAAGMAAQTGAEAGSTHCSALAARQLSYSCPAPVPEGPSAATGSGALGAAQGNICADFQVAGSGRWTPIKAASATAVSGAWGSVHNSASADAVATSTSVGVQSVAGVPTDSTQPGSPAPGNSSHDTSGDLGAAAGVAAGSAAGEGSAAEQHNPQPVARGAHSSMLWAAGSAEAADSSGAAAAELQHSGRPSMARLSPEGMTPSLVAADACNASMSAEAPEPPLAWNTLREDGFMRSMPRPQAAATGRTPVDEPGLHASPPRQPGLDSRRVQASRFGQEVSVAEALLEDWDGRFFGKAGALRGGNQLHWSQAARLETAMERAVSSAPASRAGSHEAVDDAQAPAGSTAAQAEGRRRQPKWTICALVKRFLVPGKNSHKRSHS